MQMGLPKGHSTASKALDVQVEQRCREWRRVEQEETLPFLGGDMLKMPKDAMPTLYPIFVTAKRHYVQAEKQAASSIFPMTRVRKYKKS